MVFKFLSIISRSMKSQVDRALLIGNRVSRVPSNSKRLLLDTFDAKFFYSLFILAPVSLRLFNCYLNVLR